MENDDHPHALRKPALREGKKGAQTLIITFNAWKVLNDSGPKLFHISRNSCDVSSHIKTSYSSLTTRTLPVIAAGTHNFRVPPERFTQKQNTFPES